ncbi:hypothetical protein WCX49_02400 [Sulfurimonas sp. HSL-1656]|uniref:hypothetical protein n=1 Tax=Thiomicrolovo subterrani TaxID=3131934 RepID=UPI0031F747AE
MARKKPKTRNPRFIPNDVHSEHVRDADDVFSTQGTRRGEGEENFTSVPRPRVKTEDKKKNLYQYISKYINEIVTVAALIPLLYFLFSIYRDLEDAKTDIDTNKKAIKTDKSTIVEHDRQIALIERDIIYLQEAKKRIEDKISTLEHSLVDMRLEQTRFESHEKNKQAKK